MGVLLELRVLHRSDFDENCGLLGVLGVPPKFLKPRGWISPRRPDVGRYIDFFRHFALLLGGQLIDFTGYMDFFDF